MKYILYCKYLYTDWGFGASNLWSFWMRRFLPFWTTSRSWRIVLLWTLEAFPKIVAEPPEGKASFPAIHFQGKPLVWNLSKMPRWSAMSEILASAVPIHDACLQCGCLYVGFQSLVVALLPRQWVICQEFVAAKYPFRARDASLQLSDCSVFAPQKAECRSCDDAMPRMKDGKFTRFSYIPSIPMTSGPTEMNAVVPNNSTCHQLHSLPAGEVTKRAM